MFAELTINFAVMVHRRALRRFVGLLVWTIFELNSVVAQTPAPAAASAPQSLKKLSIEELIVFEVTSVSRRPEKLSETGAFERIEVISGSGATLWGAISRALRTPSRIDTELFIPAHPPFLLMGIPDFKPERALSYELGYRTHPHERLSLSASAFYTDYTNLRSLEQANAPSPFPFVVGNGLEGRSYGVELTADYQISDWWRVRGGLTEMRLHIRPRVTSTDRTGGNGESHDPNRHFVLRSSLEPVSFLQVDSTLRYVSEVTDQRLPGYAELDLRLDWQSNRSLEFSITGQNLLHDRHAEFGSPATRQLIGRSVYGKIV